MGTPHAYNFVTPVTLAQGTRLAYNIVAPRCAGGRGEVYRARDTRLDGTLAITISVVAAREDVR